MPNNCRLTIVSALLLVGFGMAGLPRAASAQDLRITQVYVPKGQDQTVLFDTKATPGQVLITDPASVFTVLATSTNQEWAVLSKMSTDPDEAHGTNEQTLLMYVPQKRIIPHPQHGAKASVVSIEAKGTAENVLWFLDGQETTTALPRLRAWCLKKIKAWPKGESSLEENPGKLVGQTYLDLEKIEPDLRLSSEGPVISPTGEFRLSTYRKSAWEETDGSREKALYVLAKVVGQEKTWRATVKSFDVLYLDLDAFPVGALQVGDRTQLCVQTKNKDAKIIAVFPGKNAEKGVRPYKAWRADGRAEKFLPLSPAEVRCKYWPEESE